MRGSSRRQFVRGALAGAVALGWARRAGAVSGEARPPRRPHYVVHVMLSGGFDSVLTVDPKDAGIVGDRIDCQYAAGQRLKGQRRLYGPLLLPLMRHERDLCLVHGVRLDTVSHDEGFTEVAQGRLAYSPTQPLIGDLVGGTLPGSAPIPHLFLGLRNTTGLYNPPRAERVLLTIRTQRDALLRPLPGARPSAALVEEEHERDARALFAADPTSLRGYLAGAHLAAPLRSLLSQAEHAQGFRDEVLQFQLPFALNAIQHDVARFISTGVMRNWLDSHVDNLATQRARLATIFADLARFIDCLKQARNAFGTLFEQTTIVIGSEIGRYPKLNRAGGKDHWPENSWILLGRGLRRDPDGLTVGGTDASFRGLAIDFRTGRAEGEQRRPIFVDSIYATLVQLAGGDPGAYGFAKDAVLDCLLDGRPT